MESRLIHEVVDDGFRAVASFLGFKSELLGTVRERVEAGVVGSGPLDPEEARVLQWLIAEWGERLLLLRDHSEHSYHAANEPVTRLVALVRVALEARGAAQHDRDSGPQVTHSESRDDLHRAVESIDP